MEENKEHKISFFTRVKWAIFNLENYDFFAVEKQRKAFGYFIKLMIVFSLLISLAITYQFSKLYKNVIQYVETEFPDFTYQNGILQVKQEEEIIQENEQGVVLIDTILAADTQEAKEAREKLNQYQAGIVLFKDKLAIKLPLSEELTEYSYQELMSPFQIGDTAVTKAKALEIIKELPSFTIYETVYLLTAFYLFVLYGIIIAMDVFLLSILGVLTSRFARLKLRYGPIVNISVYALTLSILLNALYIIVNTLTGFEIRYFQIMYNAISYIYLVTAILMIKSEMIKQEIQLMKLAEEQKKVKEDMERQQEEEKEKQEQKKKEKEKEEEEEKEGKEKQNGETPEGSNAIEEYTKENPKEEC